MVMQYRKKGEAGGRWKKYPGKDKIKGSTKDYDFRLLNEAKTKVLVKEGPYKKVLRRFRAIEFFKHR